MYQEKQTTYIKAISPIHAGTGQSLSSVDMPIQRETHSGIPKVEGSSLKGSIKHYITRPFSLELEELKELGKKENLSEEQNKRKKELEEKEDELKHKQSELFTVFGGEDGSDFASAIGITDAKLLLFPIKSIEGIFKLITCKYVLERWAEEIGNNMRLNITLSEGECISLDEKKNEKDNIVLEEYIFDNKKADGIKDIFSSIKNIDTDRIVILSDTDFVNLVNMYTEIITRNKINVLTGTADNTGLFTEEYLPSESVLYFNVLASPSFNKDNAKNKTDVLNYFNQHINSVFQIGGNATIGKGLVKVLASIEEKAGETDEQNKKY